jgi:hypothetical protein
MKRYLRTLFAKNNFAAVATFYCCHNSIAEQLKKAKMPVSGILAFLFLTLGAQKSWGQTTYTWNQTGTASWAVTTNWTPTRTTPATNDILVFNNGATTTVNAVPTQTIGQLIVSSNTTVNLQGSGAGTVLTIGGGTGTDLSVASGSALNINVATNTTTIAVGTGATGSIAGNMTFTNAAHALTAADASGITFNSPANFTQGTGCTGNVFGSGTANSVVFGSGTTFNHSAGSNPFQKTQPASVVVFQTGSLYKANQASGSGMSYSGRTYADLELNGTGTNAATGAASLVIDNLTVNAGTNGMNMTGNPGHAIKGNITVASGATLNFNPASAGTMNFSGSSAQNISNSGTLSFAANQELIISNSAGVTFNNTQTISGAVTINSGALLATTGALTISGTKTFSGAFRLNQGGSINATPTYGSASTLIYAGTTQTATATEFPGAGGPVNLTINTSTSVSLTSLFSRTITGDLTLTSGSLIDAGTLLTVGGNILGTASHSGAGKIIMTGTGKTISGATLGNLEINSGGTITLNGSPMVNGDLTLTAGTLADGGNTLTLAGNISGTASHSSTGTGKILMTGTSKFIGAVSLGNLDIQSGAFIGLALNAAVNGNLNLGGTLAGAGLTLTLSGNITGTGTETNTGGKILMTGSGKTISGASLANLELSNAGGFSLTGSPTISTLVFTTGKLSLGAFDLTASTITGATSAKFIVTDGSGVLKRSCPAATTTTFPIGANASNFDVVTVNPTTGTNFSVNVKDVSTNAQFQSLVDDFGNVVHKQWSITPTGTPGNTVLEITNGGTVYAPGSAVIGHNSGSAWDEIPATYASNKWTATTSTFSPFGVGSDKAFDCIPPFNFTYASNPVIYCQNTQAAVNLPSVSGDGPFTYAAPALPTGLTFNTSTGVIGGAPGISIAAADYTITVTGNCGSTTVNLNLAVNVPPFANLTNNSGTTVLGCPLTAINVTASGGGAGATYTWNGGSTPNTANNIFTVAGNYTVTVTSANSCTNFASISITQFASVATDYFRSKQSGNWNSLSTWESSHNNSTWCDATLLPNSSANTITVQAMHEVTINSNVTIDQTIVQEYGTLIQASNYTLANGAGFDVLIEGTYVVQSGTITPVAGALLSYSTEGYTFLRYEGTSGAQTSTNLDWPSNNFPTFGPAEVTFNNAAGFNLHQSRDVSVMNQLAGPVNTNNKVLTVTTIYGTTNVTSTTGNLTVGAFGDIPAGSVSRLNIPGNNFENSYVVVTGNLTITDELIVGAAGNATVFDLNGFTVNLQGNLSGNSNGYITSSLNTASLKMTGVNKTIDGIYNLYNLEIASGASVIASTYVYIGSGSITINGTLTLNEYLSGSGTTFLNGTVIFVDNADIIANTITYGINSTIQYDGTTARMPGSSWPASNGPKNVVINNTGGLTLNESKTISGVLTLMAGRLTLANFNMTAGTMTGSTSSYVVTNGTGKLRVNIPSGAGGTYVFIGPSASSMNVVDLDPTTASLFDFHVKAISVPGDFSHPVNNFSLVKPVEWEIAPVGTPGSTGMVLFYDSPAPGSPVIGHYTGGAWEEIPAGFDIGNYTATINSFSPFGVGGAGGFAPACISPTVSSDPEAATICENDNITFTGSFTGGDPTPTLVWQESTDGGMTWNDLTETAPYSGTTTNILIITSVPFSFNSNQYRLKASNGCGEDVVTDAASLTVNDAVEIVIQPGDSTVCQDLFATFTVSVTGGTGLTYQWQFLDGMDWVDQIEDAPWHQLTTTNKLYVLTSGLSNEGEMYRLKITDSACGDIFSEPGTIHVNPNPTCSITGPATMCPGASVVLTAPAGMTGYYWVLEENSNGTISGSNTQQSVTVTAFANNGCNGTIILDLSITNANGCSSYCVKNILVGDVIPPVFINCPASPVSLGLNPPPVTQAQAIAAAGMPTDNCTLGAPSATAGAITGGCTKMQTWTVSVYDVCSNQGTCAVTYTWTVSPPSVTCPADFAITTAQLPFNLAPLTSPPGGTFAGTGVAGNSFNPAIAGTYTITYTVTSNGCSNTCDFDIQVNEPCVPPEVSFTGLDGYYCINGSSATLTGNHAPLGTFSGDGITDHGNGTASFSPSLAGAGMHYITYSVTSFPGCTNSQTNITTVNALPIVAAGDDQDICINDAAVLNGSFSGGATGVLWSSPGDGMFDDPTSPMTYYSPGMNDKESGSITLTLSSADDGTCEPATDQITITFIQPYTVEAGESVNLCHPPIINLAGTTNAPSHTWFTNGYGSFGDASALMTTYTPGPIDFELGYAYLGLVTNDPEGPCGSSIDYVYYGLIFPANPNVGPDQTICAGLDVVVNATITGYSYSNVWSSSGTGTFVNPYDFSTTYTPSASDIANGTVTLTYHAFVFDHACPEATDALIVTINAPCGITGPAAVCPATNSSYSGPGGMASYEWTIISGSGVLIGSSTGQIVTVLGNGGCTSNYTLQLAIDDGNGCSSVCTKTISVEDTQLPVLTCPMDTDLGCNPAIDPVSSLPVAAPLTVPVSDNCAGNSVSQFRNLVSWELEACDRYVILDYSFQDGCGNVGHCDVTYNWKIDTNAPMFPNAPGEDLEDAVDIGCNPVAVTGATAIFHAGTVTDGCSGTLTVTAEGEDVVSDGCNRIQEWTVTAEDSCENSTSISFYLKWKVDTENPVFGMCPMADITINQNELPVTDSRAINDAGPVTDNCADLVVTAIGGAVTGTCTQTQTWTVTVVDVCNHSATCSVTYTWSTDTEAPVFGSCPTAVTLPCNHIPDGGDVAAAIGTVTDNVDETPTVFTTTSAPSPLGACSFSQEFVVHASDDCNNENTCTINFYWTIDTQAPVFAACTGTPFDLGTNPPVITGSKAIMDAGGATDICGTINYSASGGPISGTCTKTQTWTVTATDGCSNSSTCEVNYTWQVAPPVFCFGNLNKCQTAPAFVINGASPAGGVYSGEGVNNNMFDPSSMEPGSYPILYTYTDVNGCIGTCSFNINVNAPADIDPGSYGPVCSNAVDIILNGGNPGGGTFAGTGVSIYNVNFDEYYWVFDPSVGTQTITYTVNVGGCVVTAGTTIEVLPGVSCPGDQMIDIEDLPLDLTSLTYSPAGGTFSGDQVSGDEFDVEETGTYTVYYTVTEGDCPGTCEFQVEVTSEECTPPVVDVNPEPQHICQSDIAMFTGSFTGSETITYQWEYYEPTLMVWKPIIDQAPFSGATTMELTITGPAFFFNGIPFHLVATNDCGTETSEEAILTLDENIVASAGGDASTCGLNYPLGGNGSGSGTGTWAMTGGTGTATFDDVNNPSTTVHMSGMDSYGEKEFTWTIVNGLCTTSDAVLITFNQLPVVTCPADITLCKDVSFVYHIPYGTPIGGYYSGENVFGGFDFLTFLASPGDYLITYHYFDGNTGCEGTCTFTITVGEPPLVTPGSYNPVCQNAPDVMLNLEFPTGGIYSGPGVSGSVELGFVFDPSVGTTFVPYTVSDPTSGCSVTTFAFIQVYNTPDPVFGSYPPVCYSSPLVALNATPTGGTWIGAGVSGSVEEGFVFDPSFGTQILTYTYTTENDCIVVGSLTIISTENLTVICPEDFDYCTSAGNYNLSTLDVQPAGGVFTGDGVSGNIFNPVTAGPGETVITYTYDYMDGCAGFCTFAINVLEDQVGPVSAGTYPAHCEQDGTVVLDQGTPAGGVWTGNSVDGNQMDGYIFYTYYGSQTLTYTVTGANGCASSAQVTILVNPNPSPYFNALEACSNGEPFLLNAAVPFSEDGIYSGINVNSETGFFDPDIEKGTYFLNYTVTDANGCSGGGSFPMQVYDAPEVSCPTTPINVDVDDPPLFMNMSTPEGGYYYGDGMAGKSFYPAIAGIGPHTITYILTVGSSACQVSCTFQIIVHPANPCPHDFTTCIDAASVDLTTLEANGGSYAGDGVTMNVFDPSEAGLGAHTITHTYDLGEGEMTCTFVITVAAPPVLTCPADFLICGDHYGTFVLSGALPEGGYYSGDYVPDGVVFYAQMAGPGVHPITYNYTDPVTGCTNTCTFNITVIFENQIDAGVYPIVCAEDDDVVLIGFPAGGTFTGIGVSGDPMSGFVFDPSVGTTTISYAFTDPVAMCTKDDIALITVLTDPPEVVCPSDMTMCKNENPISLTATPPGGTYSGSNGIVNGDTFDPSEASAGVHTITYTYPPSGSCSASCTFMITVNALPTVTCPPSFSACIYSPPFELTGGIPSDGIYTGNGVIEGTFYPAAVGLGYQSITYTITDPVTLCTRYCYFDIQVVGPPMVGAGSYGPACSNGANIGLMGSPSGGVWTGTGVSGNQMDGYVFDPSVGTQTLTYTYTVAENCTSSSNTTITVNEPPAPPICPEDMTFCLNDDYFILTPFVEPNPYSPATGIGTDFVNFAFYPSEAGPGVYPITYTITDGMTGCSNTCDFTFAVLGLPAVSCPGEVDVAITADPFALTGGLPVGGTYDGEGVTDGIFDPASVGEGYHSITYTYTDPETLCSRHCFFDVFVFSSECTPVVLSSSPMSHHICQNASATFTGSFTGSAPITYQWEYSDDGGMNWIPVPNGAPYTGEATSTLTITSPTLEYDDYQYRLRATNACSNIASSAATLTLDQFFLALAGDDDDVCGLAYNLLGNDQGFATGTWSMTSGTGVATFGNSNDSETTVTMSGMDPYGTKEFTWTIENGLCNSSDAVLITFNALPTLSLPASVSACSNEPPFALSGSPAGGTFSGIGVVGNQFDPSISGAGTFTVTYMVMGLNGCTASGSYPVNVQQAVPTNAGADFSSCALVDGFGVPIYADLLHATTNPGFDIGIWTGTGPGDMMYTNAGSPNTTVIVTQPGVYTFTWTETNFPCTTSDEVVVTFHPYPAVICPEDISVCITTAPFQLGATPIGGTYTGPGVTMAGLFNPATAGVGTHMIAYGYTDPVTLCFGSCHFNITVSASALADAGMDLTSCDLFAFLNSAPTIGSGVWTFTGPPMGNITFTPNASTPDVTAHASISGTYTFNWTVTNGACVTSDEAMVTFGDPPVCQIDGPTTVCPNSSNTFSAPSGMASYGWSILSGNASIVGAADEQDVTVDAGMTCPGTYVLQLAITDVGGCPSVCSLTVVVQDNSVPVFTACAEEPIPLGCNPTVEDYPTVDEIIAIAGTVTDACGSVTTSAELTTDAVDGCFHTNIWTVSAVDACGNEATCAVTFTFTIDTQAPQFSNCSSTPLILACNHAPTPLDAINRAGLVTDNCGTPNLTASINLTNDFGCSMLQVWDVYATDGCGNQGYCQVVFIWNSDNQVPTLSCPPNANANYHPGFNVAPVGPNTPRIHLLFPESPASQLLVITAEFHPLYSRTYCFLVFVLRYIL